jgi:hypothetical protein
MFIQERYERQRNHHRAHWCHHHGSQDGEKGEGSWECFAGRNQRLPRASCRCGVTVEEG